MISLSATSVGFATATEHLFRNSSFMPSEVMSGATVIMLFPIIFSALQF
jgi:hypothetical protein